MKKSCRMFAVLPLLLLHWSQASAGVDCTEVPHTRLELAVCGEPVLRALDSELTAAFEQARSRGLMDKPMMAEQRNQVAHQCRRQLPAAFNACLLDAELTLLERVAVRLGQVSSASHPESKKYWHYDASPAARIAQLQWQLSVAEGRLQSVGNPELAVFTILKLLSTFEEQRSDQSVVAAVDRLERRLAVGCDHTGYGAQWRKLLRENDRVCDNLQSPTLHSSVGF